MLVKSTKHLFLTLLTFLSTCVIVGAASVSYDFNSGLPAGTSVGGNAFVSPTNGINNSGTLKLNPALGSQSGGFMVPDFVGGIAVTNFRAKFKLLIGGSTCCDDAGTVGATGRARPADGFSFNFSTGINAAGPTTCCWEEGSGTGISTTFDTWDNNNGETAPSIELLVGGTAVAFQSMDGVRALGSPAGPVLTNAAGGLISLETSPAASVNPNPSNYVDVVVELFADKTVSLSFSNVVVFNHVPVPGYNPISGGNWVFGGRTGGATDNHWIDNLEILVNFTPGPATITVSPVNQTVTESQTATFSIQANGTPPYTIQWFSNNVAIAGANGLSYTTPPTTVGMNGTLYHATVQGAEGGVATSEDAMLTVNPGVFVLGAGTRISTNHVYVTYSKPVNLNGTYTLDNGVTVDAVAYGSSQSEVVLTTSQLTLDTTYTLTVSGVTGQDSSPLVPAPTIVTFRHTIGGVCTDFATLPANSAVSGDAYLSNKVVHLTDAVNGKVGAWIYSGYPSGVTIDRLHATFGVYVGGFTVGPQGADGMSFNFANDIPTSAVCCGEGGFGTGLSVTIDSWDDGSANDPSININWKGTRVGKVKMPVLRSDFVPMDINLDPDGTVDVTYDGIAVFTNYKLTNFSQITNPKLGFFARTGGENDNHWITNLCVTHNNTLGPLSIASEPADQAVFETSRATFQVILSGSPTYSIQWYSNNVAIAGATGLSYTTPPTVPAMSGQLYHAVISNGQNTVTTRDASLTVNPVIFFQTASAVDATHVRVTFSRGVSLTGTYTVTGPGGVISTTKAYGANQSEVILTLASPLTQDTTYGINIAGETGLDASPMVPDPSTGSFRFGFGAFCVDFNSSNVLPAGTIAFDGGSGLLPYITNGVLHLTDLGQPGHNSAWGISNRTDGLPLDRVFAQFDLRLAGSAPADGVAFNWGNDVLNGVGAGEEGIGSGLIVKFDTYANVALVDLGFRVSWKGAQIASKIFAANLGNSTTELVKQRFAPVAISVDPNGIFNLFYDNKQIFTNIALPNYAPIANSAYSFTARVGGANEDAWLDNVCINAFTPGPLHFVAEPVETSAPEFLSATFSTTVDGNPLFFYQWRTNGVNIPGANSKSLTFSPLTAAMDGLQVSVVASNSLGEVITSSNATLHVVLNPRFVKLVPCPDSLILTFTRPVLLDSGTYALDHDGAEAVRSYGANHSTVIVRMDTPFISNSVYQVTIQDVRNEADTLNIDPNPITVSFRWLPILDYASKTSDFNSVSVPPGINNSARSLGGDMSVYNFSYVSNGIVHITDAGLPTGTNGALVVTNIQGGAAIDRFVLRWRQTMSGLPRNGLSQPWGNQTPADGGSISIAPDVVLNGGGGEAGSGTGLVVSFDNWDNFQSGALGGGSGTNVEAPAIIAKWNGAVIRSTINQAFPDTWKSQVEMARLMRDIDATTLPFKEVYLVLERDGKLWVTYGGVPVFNGVQTPFNGSMANARVGFSGRTGGANENYWLDDLQINQGLTGPLTVTVADVTAPEVGSAHFVANVTGADPGPFAFQWFKNGVEIPGATDRFYSVTALGSLEGTVYRCDVTSYCGGPTVSGQGTLHVNTSIPSPIAWITLNDGTRTNLSVSFKNDILRSTAENPAFYSISSGGSVIAANVDSIAGQPWVRLKLSQALNPNDCNVLILNGVTAGNARTAIPVSAGFPTSGADNRVVIEAEDYDVNRPGFVNLFVPFLFANTNMPNVTTPQFVGRGYMTTVNIGAGSGGTAATWFMGSAMDYTVNFGATGTYYVWARGSTANDGSGNSFHLNVDGVSQGAASQAIGNGNNNWGNSGTEINRWGWVRHAGGVATRATINIGTTGPHVLTVILREDGIKLDRFLLTTDVNFFPSGAAEFDNGPGPDATAKPGVTLTTTHGGGNAVISWPGANWTLQYTTTLINGGTVWSDVPQNLLFNPNTLVIPDGYFGNGQTNLDFRLICK